MRQVRKFVAGSLVLGTLVLSGCGGSGGKGVGAVGSGASTAPAGAASASTGAGDVPELRDGVLNVFADGTYVPYEFLDKDGKTMRGMEVEMLDAISKKLGVRIAYQNMQFDAMIPSIANGRADLMIMAMADTQKRRQQVDFIDLYNTNYRIVTRAGNPANLNLGDNPDQADTLKLCGHAAAVTTGGQQEQVVKVLSENCVKAGQPTIKVQAYLQPTQEYLAVQNGRVDFNIMVPANADYFIKHTPGYQIIPGSFPNPQAGHTGWILSKHSQQLQDALVRVINELIKDGTWGKILAEWGVSNADAVIPPLRNGQSAS